MEFNYTRDSGVVFVRDRARFPNGDTVNTGEFDSLKDTAQLEAAAQDPIYRLSLLSQPGEYVRFLREIEAAGISLTDEDISALRLPLDKAIHLPGNTVRVAGDDIHILEYTALRRASKAAYMAGESDIYNGIVEDPVGNARFLRERCARNLHSPRTLIMTEIVRRSLI